MLGQTLQRLQRRRQSLGHLERADEAELACARHRQQVQADVGRRGAVRHLRLRHELHVVGRQVGVFGADVALVEAPGVARQFGDVGPVGGAEARAPHARAGAADPPRPQRRGRPQGQQRGRGPRVHRRALPRRPCQRPAQQRRCGRHAPVHAHEARQVAARRGLRGGCGGPLQRMAVRHELAPQGTPDRVAIHQRQLQQLRQVPQRDRGRAQQLGHRLAVEALQRDVVAARRQAGHGADHRPGAERREDERECADDRQADPRQRQHQQQQRAGRDERTAQVVEHLPAVDAGDTDTRRAEEERQQLPIATSPPVQPGRCDVGMQGRSLGERDVVGSAAARERAFDQVVTEQPPVGKSPVQGPVHGRDVEQSLAGEAAFAEEVLVDLGAGGAVRIEPALAVQQGVKARVGLGRRQRRLQARLHDAVSLDNPCLCLVPARLVQRVGGDADQRAQAAWRQVGVGVERDDVARVRRRRRQVAEIDEGPVRGIDQRLQQAFELAALAFPADPALLALAPRPLAMQEQEARRLPTRVALVELRDGAPRGVEQVGVARQGLRIGIGEVAQQRELRMPLRVRERVLLELRRVVVHGRHRAEDHRHHDQGLVIGRQPLLERQPRQARRPCRFADQPVDDGDAGLADRPGGAQQGHDPQQWRQLWRHTAHDPGQHRGHGRADRQQVQRRDRASIGRRAAPRDAPRRQTEATPQFRLAGTAPPISRRGLRVIHRRGTGRQIDQRLRHVELAATAVACELFDRVQRLALGDVVLGGVNHAVLQPQQRGAGRLDEAQPVDPRQRMQGRDRVAHALLVLGGFVLLRGQCAPRVGQALGEPRRAVARRRRVLRDLQALPDRQQVGRQHTAPLERGQHRRRRPVFDHGAVDPRVRRVAGRVACDDAFGEAAQVLDQNDPQRGVQRRQLAQCQRLNRLVGLEITQEQVLVEVAVAVRHPGPGHAVDARQPAHRVVAQHRQAAVEATRQRELDR